METRILQPTDHDLITAFEKNRLEQSVDDPMEREMQAWNARWRKEALEHYLPQGWSFGVYGPKGLRGYFLGQPYLFHRGLTQTLWIEHLAYEDAEIAKHLVEVAHKWARDKHLQTVLFENNSATAFVMEEFPKAMLLRDGLIELRSAKF